MYPSSCSQSGVYPCPTRPPAGAPGEWGRPPHNLSWGEGGGPRVAHIQSTIPRLDPSQAEAVRGAAPGAERGSP